MVSNIAYFEYIVTDTEIEALVLECNLIKKHRPKYNILLKDDKQYPYIKVSINQDYSRIFMSRTLKNDGAKYFGPYAGMQTVRNTLNIVQKIFKPPTCSRKFPQDIGKERPCLNYHINKCFAPCVSGNVSRDEYRRVFFDICSFLEGKHDRLITELTEQMNTASKKMQYESAAALRDKISAIKHFEEKQKIINADKQTDTDIIAFAKTEDKVFIEMFFVRLGRITGRKSYRIDSIKFEETGEILSDFVKQYYSDADNIAGEILFQEDIADSELISKWLTEKRGRRVSLIIPKKGSKKELVEMVRKNAEISAENYRITGLKISESKNRLSAEIAVKLKLSKPPVRIESYDISNISGSDNVASMVVFVNGKPSRKDYRKFQIKSFDGANDYLAMQEVIYRRFRHAREEEKLTESGELDIKDAKFLPLPDLILLDGGKGHISAVEEIMETMDVDVPVFGMVKNSKHKTKGLLSAEGEISFLPTDGIFKFITNVQDEVHNAAIGYHRAKRSERLKQSELDSVKGVGSVKKAKLMKAFGSIEKIKNADIEELIKVTDKKTAENIINYFREKG